MISADVRMLQAGEERDRLGHEGLPLREIRLDLGDRTRIVWIGPTHPGGPEENLYELDIVL